MNSKLKITVSLQNEKGYYFDAYVAGQEFATVKEAKAFVKRIVEENGYTVTKFALHFHRYARREYDYK